MHILLRLSYMNILQDSIVHATYLPTYLPKQSVSWHDKKASHQITSSITLCYNHCEAVCSLTNTSIHNQYTGHIFLRHRRTVCVRACVRIDDHLLTYISCLSRIEIWNQPENDRIPGLSLCQRWQVVRKVAPIVMSCHTIVLVGITCAFCICRTCPCTYPSICLAPHCPLFSIIRILFFCFVRYNIYNTYAFLTAHTVDKNIPT